MVLLIITFIIGFSILFPILYSKFGKEDKEVKLFYKSIIPYCLVGSDIFCLIITNVFELNLIYKLIYVVFSLISIIFAVLEMYKKLTNKNKDLIILLRNSIVVDKLYNLFDIHRTETTYSSSNNASLEPFNIEKKDDKLVIYNRMGKVEFIPKKKLDIEEIKCICEQLNKNCDWYLVCDNPFEKLNNYKVALFKDKELYKCYKNVNYKLLEKAKEGEI